MRTTRIATLGALCLFALLSVTGCASTESRVIVRTETVDRPVPVYRALDPVLTAECPTPELPERPLMNEDLVTDNARLQSALEDCGSRMTRIRALQNDETRH